jgi:succinate dehydrogenase/fumarate reductase-like Fe-S protein
MPTSLKALWLLTWASLRTLLRWIFRASRGLDDFNANYKEDGLKPVTPEERANMGRFSRCIACGLCDRGEGQRIAESRGEYLGVMALVLAGSRSAPEFAAANAALLHVTDAVLREKEEICPSRVPIVEIAQFVRRGAPTARLSGRA